MADLFIDKLQLILPDGRIANAPTSFHFCSGQLCLITGANGCGKSTLLRSIHGLHSNFRGKVALNFDGNDCNRYKNDYSNIWYQAQENFLFQVLNVRDNLFLSRPEINISDDDWSPFPELALKARKDIARLSGGERKMVALLCAKRSGRPIVLLDEPIAGLSFRASRLFADAVRKIATNIGSLVIVVEHNLSVFQDVVDQHVILYPNK